MWLYVNFSQSLNYDALSFLKDSWIPSLPQVPTVAQNSGGHGLAPSPAVHSAPHHHSPAAQSHGPPVLSGHGHTAVPPSSAQGHQQFQRLKVSE